MTAPHGRSARTRWLGTLRRWHWISSALALVGMMLFAITGLTLNHASQIEGHPVVVARQAQMPATLLAAHAPTVGERRRAGPLTSDLADWIAGALQVEVHGRAAEWSPEEIYVPLARPGADAWVRLDRTSGAAEFEDTSRGWVSTLNDLHKGRNAGAAWRWFIDAFAFACLVFCTTGLFILKLHADTRPGTWPLVGLGLVLPLLLALLFIH
jgi:hypothetical protein